jgi:hypothetical protein
MLSPIARFNVGLESGAPGTILAHNMRESHLGQLRCFVATGTNAGREVRFRIDPATKTDGDRRLFHVTAAICRAGLRLADRIGQIPQHSPAPAANIS